jgi:hypothetical protein
VMVVMEMLFSSGTPGLERCVVVIHTHICVCVYIYMCVCVCVNKIKVFRSKLEVALGVPGG